MLIFVDAFESVTRKQRSVKIFHFIINLTSRDIPKSKLEAFHRDQLYINLQSRNIGTHSYTLFSVYVQATDKSNKLIIKKYCWYILTPSTKTVLTTMTLSSPNIEKQRTRGYKNYKIHLGHLTQSHQ